MANSPWGDFVNAQETAQRNIIWASQGPGGSGKTHFLLTAPDPIAVFLFDPAGLKSLVDNPLFKSKDIKVIDFSKLINMGSLEKDDRAKQALEVAKKLEDAWDIALKNARTIGFDKEEHVWELLRYAYNENFSAEPKDYYEINMAYRGMFTAAEVAGVNFGLIRGVKEKYGKVGVNFQTGKDKMGFTGEIVANGQKHVEELVQVNFSHRWDNDERVFVTKILEKCRLSSGNVKDLLGKEYNDIDFPTMATNLFPDTEITDWL